MGRDLVVIFSADTFRQAETIEQLLHEAGIEVLTQEDEESTWMGDSGEIVPPKLFVNAEDELRARVVLENYQKRSARIPVPSAEAPPTEAADTRNVGYYSLPACSSCGAPRLGTCSYCNATISHFDQVEGDLGPEQATGAVSQLICPVCREPTMPKWSEVCSECHHPFPAA